MSAPTASRTRPPATVRLARRSASRPWRAVGGWLLFVVLCVGIGQAVHLKTATQLDTASGQSGRAEHVLHDAHLSDPVLEQVLVTARAGSLSGPAAAPVVADVRRRMAALPEVASVGSPVTSAHGGAVMVPVTMRADVDTADDHVDALLTATAAAQKDYPQLRVEEVGAASLDKAVNKQVSTDLSTAASVSLPVTIVILLVAFGAILAAGVPVLLALSSVFAATGLSAVVSHVIPDSGSTSSVILLMGMAVGVDYSLFYVKRVREERHRGRDELDALTIAAETAGHSVVVSGTAVVISMLGLFLVRDITFASLAAGSVIVVAIAVLGSLTVLPALLTLLGKRIDRPRVPVLWRLTSQDREPRVMPHLLKPALNHPGRSLAAAVLVLAALAAPALTLRLHSDTNASLPDVIAEKHSFERLSAAFPGQQATNTVVVKAPAAQAQIVNTRLEAITRTVTGNSLFVADSTDDKVLASADGTVHRLDLDTPYDPESTQARAALQQLRGTLAPSVTAGLAGASWSVTGDTAESVDTDHGLANGLPWVIGFVVLLTTAVMGWVFRSAVIALTTAAANLLSAGAAFGVLVLVFQHHWADGLLGFHSTGTVINWIPLFTFAVLFGLSMDYHVFVVSQIREAAMTGVPTREAVRAGLTRSMGSVTSAAVVMVSVFSVFAALHMVEMKELGVGLAVAVLVDAVVVRLVLLPSLMVLLGRWNWWPGKAPEVAAAQVDRPQSSYELLDAR